MTDRPGDDVVARSGVWTIGAVTVAAVAHYVIYGPNRFVVQVWLWSLVLLVLRTWFLDPRPPRLPRGDIRALLGIAVVALPIYLLGVADVPLQVQSDEVSVTLAMRRFATGPPVDPFGVSDYLGHAYGALLVYGELAQHLASVDLVTVRSINGVVSVGALLAIYLLARQLLPRRWALVAVTVVGVNHAFFSFGRMAVRETSITLVAALAMALLLRSLRHGHPGAAVLGGVVLGLGWYTYFPSRVLVLLWFAFLAGLWLVRQRDVDVRRLRSVAAWSGVAFALTVAPLVVALVKGSDDPGTNVMTRNALFIFADAREIQQDWVGADSVADGWWRNVRDGVTAFGNDVPDRSLHYSNPGHGFVDPVTAALLWIGVVVTAVQLWRRAELWSWLPFGCFVAFWLAFAMLVNKAPSYARLLIVLPFVGYLAAAGLRALCRFASRGHHRLAGATALASLGAVVALNASYVDDHRDRGLRPGDDIGDTGRLITDVRDVPGIALAIATDDDHPYFVFAEPWMIDERLRFFADGHGTVRPPVDPDELSSFEPPGPFALFMTDDVWADAGDELRARYPDAVLREVMPDGSRVVLVQEAARR